MVKWLNGYMPAPGIGGYMPALRIGGLIKESGAKR
jgi:hypothetical protein